MSGEFGDCGGGGYFHDKVRNAHEDLTSAGTDPLIHAYAELFEPLVDAARAISWWQAGDSSKSHAYQVTSETLSSLRSGVHRLEYEIAAIRAAEVEAYLQGAQASLPVPRFVDADKKQIELVLPRLDGYVEDPSYAQMHRWEVRERAIVAYVSRWASAQGERGTWGDESWSWTSRGGTVGSRNETWHFVPSNSGQVATKLIADLAAIATSEVDPALGFEAMSKAVREFMERRK